MLNNRYSWWFDSPNPCFAHLPNVLFYRDGRVVDRIKEIFHCSLGVWGKYPRYDTNGILDGHPADCEYLDIWKDWKLPLNQQEIREYCTDRCGFFETGSSIIVDADIDIIKMDQVWLDEPHSVEDTFRMIPQYVEVAGWLAMYIYERHHFLLVAQEQYAKEIELLKEFLRTNNTPFGWVTRDEYNEAEGHGILTVE